MLSLMLSLIFLLPSFATAYPNNFPSDITGLTGGCFITARSGSSQAVIIIPNTFRTDYFTFTTSGEVYNCSNTTINGRLYLNNNLFPIRWQSFSLPQYYHQVGGYNQWTDIVISNITDTNIEFDTTNRELANDSLYLTKQERITYTCLFTLIFFVFLGWFMWHRQSLKY